MFQIEIMAWAKVLWQGDEFEELRGCLFGSTGEREVHEMKEVQGGCRDQSEKRSLARAGRWLVSWAMPGRLVRHVLL